MEQENWHSLSSSEVLEKLKTSDYGLSEEEIEDAFDYNYHLKNVDVISERVGL